MWDLKEVAMDRNCRFALALIAGLVACSSTSSSPPTSSSGASTSSSGGESSGAASSTGGSSNGGPSSGSSSSGASTASSSGSASSGSTSGGSGCTYASPNATIGPVSFSLTSGDPDCSTTTQLPASSCTANRGGECSGTLSCSYTDTGGGGGSFKGKGDFTAANDALSGTMTTQVVTNPPNQKQISCTYQFSATVM
jgi:hypothetical protein